jgi:hypothetical protein
LVYLKPIFNTRGMEIVPDIAGKWSNKIIFFIINHANRAIFELLELFRIPSYTKRNQAIQKVFGSLQLLLFILVLLPFFVKVKRGIEHKKDSEKYENYSRKDAKNYNYFIVEF